MMTKLAIIIKRIIMIPTTRISVITQNMIIHIRTIVNQQDIQLIRKV